MLRRADAFCLRVATNLAVAGLSVLVAFAVATLLDGLARSLLDRPIEAVADVGDYVAAAAVSACFPLAQMRRANITIELAGMALGARAARLLRALAAILVGVVMLAMSRQMLLYAASSASGGDTTVMLGIPTAPFWYVVAAMFVCAAVAQMLVAATECARVAHPVHG